MTGKSAPGIPFYQWYLPIPRDTKDSLYVLLNRSKTFLLSAAMTFLMQKWNSYFDVYFDMWPNLRRWLKHCSAHSVLVPWMSEKIGRSGWNWHTGSFRRHFGLTWFFIWNLSTRYPVSFKRISAPWLPFFVRFCRNGWNSQARSYLMYLKCRSLSHLSDSSWANSWDGN